VVSRKLMGGEWHLEKYQTICFRGRVARNMRAKKTVNARTDETAPVCLNSFNQGLKIIPRRAFCEWPNLVLCAYGALRRAHGVIARARL